MAQLINGASVENGKEHGNSNGKNEHEEEHDEVQYLNLIRKIIKSGMMNKHSIVQFHGS